MPTKRRQRHWNSFIVLCCVVLRYIALYTYYWLQCFEPWYCRLGVRKSIDLPVKKEWWGADVVICLQRGAIAYDPADANRAIPPRRLLLHW